MIELVTRTRASRTIRYPGGNFVSGFRWEDSVGPRDRSAAPPRPGLALHGDQRVGLHEFSALARQGRQRADAGRQPRHPRHRGGAGPARIRQPAGRHRADRPTRRQRQTEPLRHHACGAWATRWTARGRSATGPPTTTASSPPRRRKAMRQLDPSLELVVCGSSSAPCRRSASGNAWCSTQTYDDVDYISCHAYYEETDGDLAAFSPPRWTWTTSSRRSWPPPTTSRPQRQQQDDQPLLRRMERLVHRPLPARRQDAGIDDWPVAPRLLEDLYSVADAVVVGNLLITLLSTPTGSPAPAWPNWSTSSRRS